MTSAAAPGVGTVTAPSFTPVLAGGAGLVGAVAVRVGVAGDAGASSLTAGLVFAGALFLVAAGLGYRPASARRWLRSLVVGGAGALVLCLGPLIAHGGPGPAADPRGLPAWAAGVTAVAVAEEVLLRGALFDAVALWRGDHAAVVLTALAFGLLHAPVYGWSVVPLDVAVGLGLGALRLWTGGILAPAFAHVVADLGGWWLR